MRAAGQVCRAVKLGSQTLDEAIAAFCQGPKHNPALACAGSPSTVTLSEVGGDADELAVARAQDVVHAVFLRDLRLGPSVRARAVQVEVGVERIQRVVLAGVALAVR